MRHARRTGKRNGKRLAMLTFEWILLISLLVIGIIGGLSAVRNALLCELTDLADCIDALNVCGCSGTCGPGDGTPYPDCCNDPWWCWQCNK